MTDAPKKRPWLQFHLSTAVVLMFVAGGLLWANTVPRDAHMTSWAVTYRGWPECIYINVTPLSSPTDFAAPAQVPFRWDAFGIGVNICVAAAFLFVTAFICEYVTQKPRRNLRPHWITLGLLTLVALGLLARSSPLVCDVSATTHPSWGWPRLFYHGETRFPSGWQVGALFEDLLVWLVLLLAAAIVTECLIRRKERRP
ncbi:MAG: hypothetical protein NTW87_05535 [Planctomycetota bacterium]|nr:hypothetical protein [Planctomycetota bacterium]